MPAFENKLKSMKKKEISSNYQSFISSPALLKKWYSRKWKLLE